MFVGMVQKIGSWTADRRICWSSYEMANLSLRGKSVTICCSRRMYVLPAVVSSRGTVENVPIWVLNKGVMGRFFSKN